VENGKHHGDVISTYHQSFPTNGKVALVADVDGDGGKELIIASTDRVVRVFKWVREDFNKGLCFTIHDNIFFEDDNFLSTFSTKTWIIISPEFRLNKCIHNNTGPVYKTDRAIQS
jgi:hypothetical protein